MGKAIQVRSENGPYQTTIDCGQQQAFRAVSGESVTTVIDGFKIINGFVSSGADWGGDGIIRIYNDGGTESSLTVKNCIFTGHTVTATYLTTTVGIIIKSHSTKRALIENCLFYGNTINGGGWVGWLGSGGGGGVICFPAIAHGAYDVVNCTIANNTLNGSGKIIPVETISGSIKNCISWGNSAPNYPGLVANDQATLMNWGGPVTYSVASGGVMISEGAGVLVQDPLFVNPASGDYNLATGSPAKNAGDPTSEINLDGSRADIGFRENLASPHPDTDRDGIIDLFETGTGTYVSPSNTGSNPNLADTDGDGLNDGDEVNLYGSNPNIKDSDGDGFEDGFEVYTGYNPASAASTPEAQSSMLTAVEFRFNAANGQTYRIESSTDLSNWSTVETGISGAGARITRFYSIEGQTRRFYRAKRD